MGGRRRTPPPLQVGDQWRGVKACGSLIVVGLRDASQRSPRPNPLNRCYLMWQKEFCRYDSIKDLEEIILDYLGVGKCNQKGLYSREVEAEMTTEEGGGQSEARCYPAGFGDEGEATWQGMQL